MRTANKPKRFIFVKIITNYSKILLKYIYFNRQKRTATINYAFCKAITEYFLCKVPQPLYHLFLYVVLQVALYKDNII